MTTKELIEKYGIGYNCLSDAYALGMADGLDVLEHAIEKARADAIEEYSNQLWQVIEKCTVNCKLDFNINDLHNLEVIIKGLAEELKEQKNE